MAQDQVNWDERYQTKNTPWDSGEVSVELRRVVGEGWFKPSRMLEIGCGTGTNAVWLAQQGFTVTAFDLSPLAIEQARARADKARVDVRFFVGNALELPDLGEPFPFVFDRGVYHHLRSVDLAGFRKTLERMTTPGSYYLTLAGNGNEQGPPENGPPTVLAHEIVAELGPIFHLVQLREFRFDGVVIQERPVRPLGWSILSRRK